MLSPQQSRSSNIHSSMLVSSLQKPSPTSALDVVSLVKSPFKHVQFVQSCYFHSIHIRTLGLAVVHSNPCWQKLNALPKLPVNQLKPVMQSRQQALKAYCPNIYILLLFCKIHNNLHHQNCIQQYQLDPGNNHLQLMHY